jgi:hypothetical protein
MYVEKWTGFNVITYAAFTEYDKDKKGKKGKVVPVFN